jgi:hypothetical protein
MKILLTAAIALAFTVSAFAQQAPLTQSEYVKLLYAIPTDAKAKPALIDALRTRGIAFNVTDGIRGLTRSKGANDDELRRALEEAGRRRADPTSSQLPPSKEAAELLERARKATLEAVEEMPDFVVKQQVQRSASYAGTNNFRNLDRLVVAVSYRATGEETYRLLSLNGLLQTDPQEKRSYEQAGGSSSTGEFVTMLATVFKPVSQTRFDAVETDILRGRRSIVYMFEVDRDKARQMITSGNGASSTSTISGMKGRIWIDRESSRVLKIESEATEIPADFPITGARRIIDYDWVMIADERVLLPSISDVRLTVRDGSRTFETRNLIRFRDYQKFGSEVVIRDDDVSDQ